MNTAIAEILDSKNFVRGASVCLTPKAYLEPVVDNFLRLGVKEEDIKVSTSIPVINANADETQNISYARVMLKAVIPGYENNVLGNDAEMMFMYALDQKKGISFKTANGRQVRACTNLMVWSDGDVREFIDNHLDAQKHFESYRDELGRKQEEFIKFHNALQNQGLTTDESHRLLGFLLTNVNNYKHGATSYGQTCVTKAVNYMTDKKSKYFTQDFETDGWNVFGALTQHFTDSSDTSFYQRPDKTMALVEAFKGSGFFPNLVSLN